ncbi:MAG: hypothetical protein NTW26_11750 [bacterium]|nr:hypothetical protein [bacterium]
MPRIFFFILLTATLSAAQLNVAFMLSEPRADWEEVIGFFTDDGRFGELDYYDCVSGTPPLGVFVLYDVVVVGGVPEYLDPVVFGDRLADYVDQGGLVVVEGGKLAHKSYGGIGGRWYDDGYSPYYSMMRYPLEGPEDLIIDQPDHYIFNGVSGLFGCNWRVNTTMREGAAELAHYSDAGGVAVNAAESVVGLNFLITDVWTGDGHLIMANAACFLAGYADVQETSWGQIKATF